MWWAIYRGELTPSITGRGPPCKHPVIFSDEQVMSSHRNETLIGSFIGSMKPFSISVRWTRIPYRACSFHSFIDWKTTFWFILSREIAGTPNSGTSSNPYYSHITPTRIPSSMGLMVWVLEIPCAWRSRAREILNSGWELEAGYNLLEKSTGPQPSNETNILLMLQIRRSPPFGCTKTLWIMG